MRNFRIAKSPPMQSTQAMLLRGLEWSTITWRAIATIKTSRVFAGVRFISIRTNSSPTTIVRILCRYVSDDAKYTSAENILYISQPISPIRTAKGEKPKEHQPEKVYNRLQEMVDEFWEYSSTFTSIKDIAYASLYSAICPPVFEDEFLIHKHLLRYQKYLSALQEEYLDLIEFCFDETIYPDALGKLHPAERFCIYRFHHKRPAFSRRTETMTFSSLSMSGDTMPYGCDAKKVVRRMQEKI